MISVTRRRLTSCAMAASALALVSVRDARAQGYPSRPIVMLVGGAAGSVPDTVARLVGEVLGNALGQRIIIENRPGAGGILAMQRLVGSEPDGHTLALATMSQAVFNSYLFASLPYDPLRDLEPVSNLVTGAMAIAANRQFSASSLAELVAMARTEPGRITIGTASNGSPPHVVTLMFLRAAGIEATLVPFTSGQEGLRAVMRGDVQIFVDAPTIIVPQLRAGTLKVIAVTGRAREPELPDVPTVREAGFPDATGEAWIGLVAPARTPTEIVAHLSRELSALLSHPDLRERLGRLSFVTIGSSPEAFARLIREEHARWGNLIRETRLRL